MTSKCRICVLCCKHLGVIICIVHRKFFSIFSWIYRLCRNNYCLLDKNYYSNRIENIAKFVDRNCFLIFSHLMEAKHCCLLLTFNLLPKFHQKRLFFLNSMYLKRKNKSFSNCWNKLLGRRHFIICSLN